MNIEISKERMLEMAKKLASMDFCPEQRVFYKNILHLVLADIKIVVRYGFFEDFIHHIPNLARQHQ